MAIINTTFSAFDGIAAPAVSVAGSGRLYFDSTTNTFKVSQDGSAYRDLSPSVGITADRPAAPYVGQQYFDTTIGFPVWWDGVNWIAASGVPA